MAYFTFCLETHQIHYSSISFCLKMHCSAINMIGQGEKHSGHKTV